MGSPPRTRILQLPRGSCLLDNSRSPANLYAARGVMSGGGANELLVQEVFSPKIIHGETSSLYWSPPITPPPLPGSNSNRYTVPSTTRHLLAIGPSSNSVFPDTRGALTIIVGT